MNPCAQRVCSNQVCGEIALPDLTEPPNQTIADCKVVVCMKGVATEEEDTADKPADTDCSLGACVAGVPKSEPRPVDTPCGVDDALYCDGAGNCVGCTSTTQCPAPPNACVVATCDASGTCGTANTGVPTQVPGDCRKLVCDGSGSPPLDTADDMDVPIDDGNPCTPNVCANGAPLPIPDNTVCASGKCCAGSCIAASSDPANCGECGRTCAVCVGTSCAATVIEDFVSPAAPNNASVSSLEQDANGVYWAIYSTTGSGVVRRWVKATSTKEPVYETFNTNFGGVFPLGSYSYLLRQQASPTGGVYRCETTNCAATLTQLAQFHYPSPALHMWSTANDVLFFRTSNASNKLAPAMFYDGATDMFSEYIPYSLGVFSTTAHGNYAYWSDEGTSTIRVADYTGFTPPTLPFSSPWLTNTAPYPARILTAGDDGKLYWVVGTEIHRGNLGLAAGTEQTVITGEVGITDMTVSLGQLFWASNGAGNSGIWTCKPASCAATKTKVASTTGVATVSPGEAPEFLIADDKTVYFSTYELSTRSHVLRAPRLSLH